MKQLRHTLNRILLIRLSDNIIKDTLHPRQVTPPFALKYIQAIFKKTKKRCYATLLIDAFISEYSPQEILNISIGWRPDAVVLHSSVRNAEFALSYAQQIKEYLGSVLIFAIGSGPGFFPEKYFFDASPFDIIIRGEPEEEICGIIEKINKGARIEEIKIYYNKSFKQNKTFLVNDINSLPFPFYTQKEIEAYKQIYPLAMYRKVKWGHILTSRGCANKCIFCSSITRESSGNMIRLRNAVNVIDEVDKFYKNGINAISFADDNFAFDKSHVFRICKEFIKRKLKIKWICHVNINDAEQNMLLLMKKAGCLLLKFGVESGSPRIIELINKSDDGYGWIEKSIRAFNYARKLGMQTHALFIIGNPGETKKETKQTVDFAKRLRADLIQIHFFTPYADSKIFIQIKNHVKNKDMDKIYHYNYPLINLSNLSSDELWKMRRYFYMKYYLNPQFIIRHIFKYLPFYCFNSDILIRILKIKNIVIKIRN